MANRVFFIRDRFFAGLLPSSSSRREIAWRWRHRLQGRSCQLRDGRPQRVLAKSNNGGLVLNCQNGGARRLWPSMQIDDRSALLLLCNRLLIDPAALGQHPQAFLTILYRSTDCLCRRGAPA